jgi:hypothetical protein
VNHTGAPYFQVVPRVVVGVIVEYPTWLLKPMVCGRVRGAQSRRGFHKGERDELGENWEACWLRLPAWGPPGAGNADDDGDVRERWHRVSVMATT